MMYKTKLFPKPLSLGIVAMAVMLGFATPRPAAAHCDTMNGPVVQAAQQALAKGDVTPVLKWLKPDREADIRKAFQETLVVHAQGPAARQLADRYFFETIVRIHRQGEGAPYTGLKPEGSQAGPAIEGADQGLQSGSVEALVKLVSAEVSQGIRTRFAHAMETKKHAEESVAEAREFVAAYVEFIHHVERIHQAAGTAAGHHEAAAEVEPTRAH
jgi:hypothetical protein